MNMMQKSYWNYWLLIPVLFFFLDCTENEHLQPALRIGVLLSLTGSGSSTGESCQVAMNLAKGDIKQYLSELHRDMDMEFIVKDSRTDPETALEKMAEFRESGCQVVIGPYSSVELLRVKDYCDQNDMIAISPSSVAISLAIEGDNVYRMAPDDRNQVQAIVALLKDDQTKNLVAIGRDDLWGNELFTAIHESYTQAGGEVSGMVSYPPETVDFSSFIDDLSNLLAASLQSYDESECGVYLISFKEGTEILEMAAEDTVLQRVTWYGSSAFAENSTLPLNTDAAAFAAAHDLACPVFGFDESVKDKWEPLVDRLIATLGRNPEIYALNVYDALWLTVLTYLSVDEIRDLEAFKRGFEVQCANYCGVTGRTKLNPAGDRLYAVYDFWGIRNVSDDFRWYRTAAFNNATGELKRY